MSLKSIAIRVLLTAHLLVCCLTSVAQIKDLDKTLKDLYQEVDTIGNADPNKVENVLKLVTESNYESLSDSAKYYYHLLSSDEDYNKKGIEDIKAHIENAIKLCESSTGILNHDYIYLLMKQGKYLEEIDLDNSIRIYQKAILVSLTLLYKHKELLFNFELISICFGNVMSSLADLYDKKGWTTNVEELYKTAFSFRKLFYDKKDPEAYTDLNMLSNYYERNNEIQKAIDVLKWEINDIKENGYYGSSAYVNALYFLGSMYSKDNQDDKSLEAYRTAVQLAIDSLAGEAETLFYLYGNYCVKLAEMKQLEELDNILPIAHNYYAKLDTINVYADILFLITNRLFDQRMFDEADKYCDSLLLYPSYHNGYEEVIYSKKAMTSFGAKHPDVALQWQKKALDYCLKHNGENSIIYTNYLSDLAYIYKENSLTEESLNSYLKLVEIIEKNNRDTIPFFNQTINEVCDIYNESKNIDLEYQFMKERKQCSYNKYGSETPFYAWICNLLSVLEMNSGKLEEANDNNQIAERLYYKLEGEKSKNYAITLHNKGRLLMLYGKYSQALKALTKSRQIQIEVNGKIFDNTKIYIHEIEERLKK